MTSRGKAARWIAHERGAHEASERSQIISRAESRTNLQGGLLAHAGAARVRPIELSIANAARQFSRTGKTVREFRDRYAPARSTAPR